MNKIILGIDPGPLQSGFVFFDGEKPTHAGIESNNNILTRINEEGFDMLAIERIRGYGIVAGDDTFSTCEWIGRFDQVAAHVHIPCKLIPRKDIKKHLCGNITTTDKYVRQALIDRLGTQGTKKHPGPLFGISGHCWAALAVCVVAWDEEKDKGTGEA